MKSQLSTLILITLLFSSFGVSAESILCIPEKAFGIKESPNKEFEPVSIDISSTKYLVTKKEGHWIFGRFGEDPSNYIPCVTEFMCTCGNTAWCGHLMRNKSGTFTYYVETGSANGSTIAQVVKGKCSKI